MTTIRTMTTTQTIPMSIMLLNAPASCRPVVVYPDRAWPEAKAA